MERNTPIRILGAAALVLIGALPADAQFGRLGDRIRDRVERKVEDKAVNEAEKAVSCALGDTACVEKAKAEGKPVVIQEGPAATPAPAANTVPAANATNAGNAANATAANGTSTEKPGEGAWVNYDFIPGTRPLFVEDFSSDTVGDFPKRLEFGDGNMEVAEWRGARYLRVTTWPGTFAIVLPETLPDRFTIEFDATPGYRNNWMIFRFAEKAADDVRFRTLAGKGHGGVFGERHQQQGSTTGRIEDGAVYRGRIMADGRYVKVYMNDTRIANIPNAELGRSNKIEIEIPGAADAPTFISNLRVMAGGRKLYDALAESGRVATQGIYFDTGSDRMRPESTATLKEIGTMLQEHPELSLTIEGHTDNTGAAQANQDLSQRRAAAVAAFLSSAYKVDPSRLSPVGLGDTKPAGANTTPEGRQQNRRVELVKK
jgi:outer membrane protein OmpA-like peptidoglycan-associated protein